MVGSRGGPEVSWQWLDGSAFPQHGVLMQQAFNLPPIESTNPLMYQGMSDRFYGGSEDVPFSSEADGIDFEGEFAVIVDHVPMGTRPDDAMAHIKLILQLNDWSLYPRPVRRNNYWFGHGFQQRLQDRRFILHFRAPGHRHHRIR